MALVILLTVLFLINELFYRKIAQRHPFVSVKLIRKVFLFHLLFALIYYIYAVYNASDSKAYYDVLSNIDIGWLETVILRNWGIYFAAYPFVVYLDFNYEMCMLLFSWFGFIGFVFTYLFFAENIKEKITVFRKYDLLKILLFLPNMHFWTASLGKGSIIFMGIMMFIYAVKFPQKRILTLLLGAFFVYCIRPHVMFFMVVGVILGVFFGSDKKQNKLTKFLLVIAGIIFIYIAFNSILAVADLQNSENVMDDFSEFASERSEGLSEGAHSGVDMNSYPLPFKLFTFWFRPMFVDAPNALGILSSLENLFYLLLFSKIFNRSFIRFIKKAPSMVKMSAVIFLLTSFAMTFVMSNLGIIMRQKAQVMYFGFFVIAYYLADKKAKERAYWQSLQKEPQEISQ